MVCNSKTSCLSPPLLQSHLAVDLRQAKVHQFLMLVSGNDDKASVADFEG